MTGYAVRPEGGMGRFVVIEGLDGAGTTTQAARLVGELEGRGQHVVATHEPTNGPVGRLARAALRAEEGAPMRACLPWLFAADRADHLARTVEPALAAGQWVVSDRYLHSSLAYQSLDLPLQQVSVLNATFRVPDLTIFLDAPVDVCLSRIGGRGEVQEIFEEKQALNRVHTQYEEVLAALGARGHRIVRLDATLGVDAVASAVLAAVLASCG